VTGKAIDEYLSATAAAVSSSGTGGTEGGKSGAGLSDQAIHMMFSANRWEKRWGPSRAAAARMGVCLC
jgi:hypothetical protein